jgi:NADP-dependent 3-hydroxy acid dehydrogenase YdfG
MNKTIMITGATAGFGRAIAEKFAKNGYNIIITGRRKERLDEVEKELAAYNVEVLSLNFDVRKRFEVEDVISDFLINGRILMSWSIMPVWLLVCLM